MSVQLEVLQIGPAKSEGDLMDSIIYNTSENKKLTAIIVKLTQLLLEEKVSYDEFVNISLKYGNKLSSSLELRELYNKRIQEDATVNLRELETVLENKELLIVRKKIGDMQEDEYEIKLAALNWDINKMHSSAEYLKKCINLIKTLPNQIEPSDASYIHELSKDDYKAIKKTKLSTECKKRLMKNIIAISKILS